MKYCEIYKKRIGCNNEDEVFQFLITNLKETITKRDYFVNWTKVFDNIQDIEIDLNILNYLIGKNNIKSEFVDLLKKHPSIARLIPILVASRETDFKILSNYGHDTFVYDDFSFHKKDNLTTTEIKKIIQFTNESGFLKLLASKRI